MLATVHHIHIFIIYNNTRTRAVRRLYSVGACAPVNFGRRRRAASPKTSATSAMRRSVIDFYAKVFQPKQPSHSHTLTLKLSGASILGVGGRDPQILGRGFVRLQRGRGRVVKYYYILSYTGSMFESGEF